MKIREVKTKESNVKKVKQNRQPAKLKFRRPLSADIIDGVSTVAIPVLRVVSIPGKIALGLAGCSIIPSGPKQPQPQLSKIDTTLLELDNYIKEFEKKNTNDFPFILGDKDDPYFNKLFPLIENATSNDDRGKLIDKIISFAEQGNSRKLIYSFYLVMKAVQKFNQKLTSKQLEDISYLFYKYNYDVRHYWGPAITDVFFFLANHDFNSFQSVIPKVADRLGIAGTRKEIFNNYFVLIMDNANTKDLHTKLEQINTAFRILNPNRDKLLRLNSIIIGTHENLPVGSAFFYGDMYVLDKQTAREENVKKNRLSQEIGQWAPEEMFLSTIFHEYGHALQLTNEKYHNVLKNLFDLLGPKDKQDPKDFLADMTPQEEYKDPSFAPNELEFGSIHIEAVVKNSDTSLKTAIKKAEEGHYVPLAMVLLSLGALSTENEKVHFLRVISVNGKPLIIDDLVDKKKLLDSIPKEYLNAIEQKLKLNPSDLLNTGSSPR